MPRSGRGAASPGARGLRSPHTALRGPLRCSAQTPAPSKKKANNKNKLKKNPNKQQTLRNPGFSTERDEQCVPALRAPAPRSDPLPSAPPGSAGGGGWMGEPPKKPNIPQAQAARSRSPLPGRHRPPRCRIRGRGGSAGPGRSLLPRPHGGDGKRLLAAALRPSGLH